MLTLLLSSVLSTHSDAAELAPAGKLGAYVGAADPADVASFESWLGRKVPVVLDFLPMGTWAEIENPNWWADRWKGTGYRVVWSIPMLPKSGGTLAQGAAGQYDQHFRTLAERLVARGQAGSVIRLGWEFNGTWFPWRADRDPQAFAAYWRSAVTAMRSVPGAAFEFDWSPNAGYTPFRLEDAYPGDAYVDYIGLDTYDQGWGDGWQDPVRRWQYAMDERYGLRWHRDFARAHGKKMTFPEWGLFIRPDGHGGGDNPYYVDRMREWIQSNDVAYALYFEFDAHDGQHSLRESWFPTASARFREAFGPLASPVTVPTTSPSTTTTTTTTTTVAPAPAPEPVADPAPAPVTKSPERGRSGRPRYQVVTADGQLRPDAIAPAGGHGLPGPAIAVASLPDGSGSWVASSDGSVVAHGNARFHGSLTGHRLTKPIVGMAATPTGLGYWLVAADGGIFTFGDAAFHGSTGAVRLVRPVVGMGSTPSGRGYWLVAADGGIFTFGDAAFHGSTGAVRLVQPIVGMASTPTGRGYWLAAADGGIFTFGDAAFAGSAGGLRLTHPVVGIATSPEGGYWLAASDGGVFAFGNAASRGATDTGGSRVVGIAPVAA